MKAALPTTLTLLGMVACDNGGPRTRDAGPDDPSEAITAVTLVASIGELAGSEAEAFGDVSAVAMDGQGVIYVADRQASMVTAFDSQGGYLGSLGGPGEGPGEYQGPVAINVSHAGQVYVRDGYRVTVIDVSLTPFQTNILDTWRGPAYASSDVPGALGQDGRYYLPHSRSLNRDGSPPEHFYLVYEQGEIVDTVHVPPLRTIRRTDPAWVRTSQSGGRILVGLNQVPFAANPLWDIQPELGVISANGDDAFIKVGTGSQRDSIQVGLGECQPVPAQEREDSLGALTMRLDSVPVPLNQVQGLPESVRNRELPDCLPTSIAIRVSEPGLIWARRWPSGDTSGQTQYDVYEAGGRLVASVTLPVPVDPTVAPWIGEDRLVVVREDSETGIDVVELYDFALMESG